MAGTSPLHPPSLNLIRVIQTHSFSPLSSATINPSCKPKPKPKRKPVLVGPACTSSSVGKQRQFATSVAFNPHGNYDLSLLDDHHNDPGNVPTPLPPKEGRFEVVLHTDAIRRLDLSPFHSAISISPASSVDVNEYLERTIGFTINYAREDPYDQRELSEIPDIRLWFVRLDAAYPWLPVLLDWRAGELARYAAMLVPHQMSMRMGVVFNPEALELLIMKKAFIVYSWMKQHGIPTPKARSKTSDMARMLGFGIGDELFDLIDEHPLSPSD